MLHLGFSDWLPNWMFFLKTLVKARVNVVVSGGTGVGKTTFLNLLLQEIPQKERIITIEDTRELQFNLPNAAVRLESDRCRNSSWFSYQRTTKEYTSYETRSNHCGWVPWRRSFLTYFRRWTPVMKARWLQSMLTHLWVFTALREPLHACATICQSKPWDTKFQQLWITLSRFVVIKTANV